MKKFVLSILLLLSVFTLSSCKPSEYVVTDDNLQYVETNDNYGVYYEIFVGSFSDSNDDGFGDLQGLINRLDYLNDGDPDSGLSLGVDGLWLMPIMKSPSYHKYDVIDYYSIDHRYGTLDDFSTLVTEANSRNIDIIIDLVINHTSDQNQWFKDAKNAILAGDFTNEYIAYYSIVTEANQEDGKTYYPINDEYYYEANFSPSMPELNMDNPAVKEEIVNIIEFWYDLGVKGFRLDATKYVYLNDQSKNLEFWNWFVTEAKAIREDTYIVGETWSGDSEIASYYANFSNFDFGMSGSEGAVGIVAKGIDDVNWFVSYLSHYRNIVENVDPTAILTPFISNHDMNRAAGYLNVEDYTMYSAASMYILSYGTPFIYYGEEIGMKGSRGTANTDANRRLAMLWGDKDTVVDPIGTTYDPEDQTNGTVKDQIKDENSLYNHYKKLIMLRNANPEIARGAYTPLSFDGYYTFGGFLSTYEDSTVGVFHNVGDHQITIDLSNYTDYDFIEVRGYVGQGSALLEGQILVIDARTSVVLR